ncbi:MAG: Rv1355c family protein [Proteobacteria bacterium]|nr:Rv1355c family protein [Pseudomonadota bacterium]
MLLKECTKNKSDLTSWKPVLFDMSHVEGQESLEQLLRSEQVVFCHDRIVDQLEELIRTRTPSRNFNQTELDHEIERHLDGTILDNYGTWVFYPWDRRLVHVLAKDEYRELRSDRNRHKITTDEQERLRCSTVGIVGLSVGKASALTLALEGVCGAFRLADFDVLSLSNMNRLQTGVHTLGVKKTVIAAREMFAIDPYLDISIFSEGIVEDNVDRFLTESGNLDLLIEECDDLFIKVRLRQRAKELRIPVIMDTNDRGLVDVERFDRDPDRPMFHGLAGHLEASALKGLSTKDKVPYVIRILGEDTMSNRGIASMFEIGETLYTWPQLASGVALGGAVTTDVARRILLGDFLSSGRFYVDMEEIICDATADDSYTTASLEQDVSLEALSAPQLTPAQSTGKELSRENLRTIVAHGIWAPSGGNCQPWRFEFRDGRLLCIHDIERSLSFLDYEHLATYLAFGAAVENMILTARSMEFEPSVRVFPKAGDPSCVCEMTFKHGAQPADSELELLEQVPLRVTNRKLGERVPLSDEDAHALYEAAQVSYGNLQLLTKDDELDAIGKLLGEGERLRFLHKVMHQEMMSEVRWRPEEVEETRNGLDIATLELSPADVAGMRLVRSWGSMKFLSKLGGGRALEKPSQKAIRAASAVGLITADGIGPESYFKGGQAMQRVWLTAAARGFAFQPMTAITYLFARLEHGGGDGLSKKEHTTLTELRRRYRELFKHKGNQAEAMLFRISRAEPPSARSLRRPVDDVLVFR